VRLVSDDEVPPGPGDRAPQRFPAGGGEGRDDDGPVGAAVPLAALRDRGRQAELALHLLAPLVDQAGRGDHQRAVGKPAHPQLGQDQPGLDGLPEADLVGEDRPPAHPAQHGLGCLHLVVERFERQVRRRQEGVEPRPAPHLGGLVDQGGHLRVDRGRGQSGQ
jgi:hypothetical protein